MKFRYKIVLTSAAVLIGLEFQTNQASANAVNDYIWSRGYAAKVSQDNIQQWLNNPNWEGADMTYRHGKPEGVVVHETANVSDRTDSNAIWNEINYMLDHADSAFVHSFVNQDGAIEIANPSFKSWGAGPVANARFIQTEQIQANSKENFAHTLFNLAVLQARYLSKYDMKPSLGGTVWSHAMVSAQLGGTDHSDPNGYWAEMAAKYFGATYTMNDYEALLEKVYAKYAIKPAKYKVGDKLQLKTTALNALDGTSLKSKQGWVGTVKSVTQKTYDISEWMYTVEFKSGNATYTVNTVLEQDVQSAPTAAYWNGLQVKIGATADKTATGQNLATYRGKTATVTSVSPMNAASSHYQYNLKLSNGTVLNNVLEQDIVALPSNYPVGSQVQVKSSALATANNVNIKGQQGWIGTIKAVTRKTTDVSLYEYTIEFKNGTTSKTITRILDQDIAKVTQTAGYKVGDTVAVPTSANAAMNNASLTNYHNWIGKVTGVSVNNYGNSHFQYTVSFPSGTSAVSVTGILQQDLTKSLPAAKYKVGSKVIVASAADLTATGVSIKDKRGQVGTVTAVTQDNKGNSGYVYTVKFNNGSSTSMLLQQDLDVAPTVNAKFTIGANVKLNSGALNALNGVSLKSKQGWVGTVTAVDYKNYANSKYMYSVKFTSGKGQTVIAQILEQDLAVPETAGFKIGSRVQVPLSANTAANGVSIVNRQDKVGVVTAVGTNNLGDSHYAYTVKFDDGSTVANILQQDLITELKARFAVNQQVALNTGALNEFNGVSLRAHQNWVGVVQSVTPKTYARSKFMYKIAFKTGTGTVLHTTVLEQDLMAPSQASYGIGTRVQVSDGALNATDGAVIKGQQYKIGAITAVYANNMGYSHYAYTVRYDDGSTQANILQQDLWSAPAAAAYKVGSQVQFTSGALDALNGTSLREKSNWIGTVQSVTPKRYANSRWMYQVVFTNGVRTVTIPTILEQDLKNASAAGYSLGTRVKVVATANKSALGQAITNRVGKYGTITKVAVNNLGYSQFAYDVRFDDGQVVPQILQQDLTR